MPFLDKLSSKLYGRRAEEEMSERQKETGRPGIEQIVTPKDRSSILTSELERQARKRKYILFGAVFLVVVVVITIIFLLVRTWYSYKSVKASQIKLEVAAPESIVSGSKVTYSVNYGNLSKVNWKNVEIALTYPDGFSFSSSSIPSVSGDSGNRFLVGNLKTGESGSFTILGTIIGDPEKPAVLKADISFVPENSYDKYSKDAYKTVKIEPLPIELSIETPLFASNGEQIRYVANYQNKSSAVLENISIVFDYPAGFAPTLFEPSPSAENRIWQFSSLKPDEGSQITVTGNLSGEPAEVKNIGVSFVTKNREDESLILKRVSGKTEIAKKTLSIKTLVNNESEVNVKPEKAVNVQINFRNDGNLGIGNLIVKAKVEGKGIDLATINALDNGRFNSEKNEIVWLASSVPLLKALKPGDGGKVSFAFQTPAKMDVETLQDKNFKVDITGTIDSPEIPAPPGGSKEVYSSKATAKIISVMNLETAVYYDDGRSGIKSTGPLPPKVGQTTTYSIYWRFSNTTNDLKNAKVEGILPPGVTCTGKKYVTYGADIVCDSRSGRVVWDLGSVSAHTGFLLPLAEVGFQVALTPGPPDIGKKVTLIQESKATAIDLFTEEALQGDRGALTTFDASDVGQGKVVP